MAVRRTRLAVSIVFAALVGATILAAGPASHGASLGGAVVDKTLDELFVDVGARVPGFAGTFVDGERLMILATNPSPAIAQAAKAALVDVMNDQSLASLEPVAVKAAHPFAQLKGWLDKVTPAVMGIPGVVLTDVDDVNNRLSIGVEKLALLRTVIESRLVALGVPREAVSIEETAPFHFQATVQDRHRPVVGGLQISMSAGYCTLGFNATRGTATGFVTNSHCTNTQGGVEGTVFYQPTILLTNKIGVESVDPVYFTGGTCAAGRRCRYSDTAFAPYSGTGATFTRGFIAAANLNSIQWNGTTKYRITQETSPLIGQQVAKVGRTSGRTLGNVVNQCVNLNVANSNITLLCQSRAGYVSQPGDSGSPVFRNESANPSDVSLKGINWGSDGTTAAFSSIGNIIRSDEMGQLTTCAAGFGC